MKQYKFVSIDGSNPNNELSIKRECYSLDLLVQTFKDFLKANGFDESKINTAINNVFPSTQPTVSTTHTNIPGTLTISPYSIGQISLGDSTTGIAPLTREQIEKMNESLQSVKI